MDNFLKTEKGFETACKLLETVNRSTDDYLFVWDIRADTRWFFGNIDKYYDIRKNGAETNSTPDMLRIIHPADRAAVLESLQEIAEGKKDTHNMDYRWINRRGDKVWINCHGTVVRTNDNEPHLMIGRVSEENLRHLFNPLTGLWNKNKLRRDMKSRLAASEGYLMFLDIDGLAAINLSHGRSYGDGLLKEAAEYCENLKGIACAYHVDHNYFALVLDVDCEDAVRQIYAAISNAMLGKCTFTASCVPIDKALFLDETQLLDSVNMTMKKAKSISNNRIEFFAPVELSEKIASLALLEELKNSVKNDFAGFELHYQPQVSAGNYEIYGVEALLRYHSANLGAVYPDTFIPVLEQSRLIKDVGLWVLRQAAAQCKIWRQTLPKLRVSVNFSTLQFEDEFLAEKIIGVLQDVGLDCTALTVEITESMELRESEQMLGIMKNLRLQGIHFALDDFGTGYSNLSYLKQLCVDEIKIDRAFVSGIERDTYNHRLISNIIEFAKDNRIRTCCEGVENTRELVTLELLLPDVIQGYLFDKPNTARNIEKTYIDQSTEEYAKRQQFITKIHEIKKELGVVHFDPKNILRENEVGLWMLLIQGQRHELYVDATMERALAVNTAFTPKECYEYCINNIDPDYFAYVMEQFEKMISDNKAVQIEFPWQHPKWGTVMTRFSGKRVQNANGMIVLEGYCKIITGVTGA